MQAKSSKQNKHRLIPSVNVKPEDTVTSKYFTQLTFKHCSRFSNLGATALNKPIVLNNLARTDWIAVENVFLSIPTTVNSWVLAEDSIDLLPEVRPHRIDLKLFVINLFKAHIPVDSPLRVYPESDSIYRGIPLPRFWLWHI